MTGAKALNCDRLHVQAEIVYRLYILDRKDVIRCFKLARHFAEPLCYRSLPRGGKWYACIVLQLCTDIGSDERIDKRFGYRFEYLYLAALAAEAQVRDNAGCTQESDRSACKALCRGQHPRQGKLEHKVNAAHNGCFGARKF
ncbi:unknown [Firmicutes bacterium CAG:240]|nr:unknown [Firmicutes bacterium CAG:240]